MSKEAIVLILIVVFAMLAIAGFVYDFVITHGQANVIVALLPMMTLIWLISLYKNMRRDR